MHLQPERKIVLCMNRPQAIRVYSRLHRYPLDGRMKRLNIAICRLLGLNSVNYLLTVTHNNPFIYFFISPLFNQVGKLRTCSHLQL